MLVCSQCQARYTPGTPYCARCGAPLPQPTLTEPTHAPEQASRHVGVYHVVDSVPSIGPGETLIVRPAAKDSPDLLLKWINQAHPTPATEAALIREYRSLAPLHHRCLPRLVEFLVTDHGMGLVLAPGAGTPLFRILYPDASDNTAVPRSRPLLPDLERVVQWGVQLTNALVYLHHQQPFPILHRGLNPWTVLLDPAGLLHVLDYGPLNAYRHLDPTSVPSVPASLFADPAVMGTLWSDPRADIYAVGRLLDFLLTGQFPNTPGAAPLFPDGPRLDASPGHERLAYIITRCCWAAMPDRFSDSQMLLDELTNLDTPIGLTDEVPFICACGHPNRANVRFCEHCGRWLRRESEASVDGAPPVPIPITYAEQGQAELIENYRQAHFAPLPRFRLREALDEVQSDPGFDQLISLEALPYVEKLPHQKDAALRVLKQMRGRALLADEVGLGKTIEAGIILKELILRRLVQRILIFCPVQLQGQWQSELYEKFDELFLVMDRDIGTSLAWRCPRLIASYDIARQRFHVEEMLRHRYDLVVLDEAHWLNDRDNGRVLRVMKNLQKKYFLLLSATPMHNSLDELYNIITLLRPGHFSDLETFRQEFVDPNNPTRPLHTDVLRGYLHAVMVRNRRTEVHLDHPFPARRVQTITLPPDPAGFNFYQDFRQFYQEHLASIGNRRFLLRMSELVERFCSSADAFQAPLNRLRDDPFIRKNLSRDFAHQLHTFGSTYPDALTRPKVVAMERGVRSLIDQGRKVLVFSQFNETAGYLYQHMQGTNLADLCLYYNENDPLDVRFHKLEIFRDRQAGALFCPGEASEGLNLQFASAMINFDLPWDPMKLEQRIGRIQRMGSPHREVLIVNLVLAGTIEEDIWRVCQDKLAMIEDVVGQLEQILGSLHEEDDLPSIFCDWFLDRPRETDDGQTVSAEVFLDEILEEPIARAQADVEQDPLNIIFDFSTDDE